MPSTTRDDCPHGSAQSLGLLSRIPAAWLAGAKLPNGESDYESAWCRSCERYLWRELGSTDWTALEPPAA
jgi:hypothetical protein